MSESLWYYTIDRKKLGPVSLDHLRSLAAADELRPTDLVWTDGMPGWIPAKTQPGLFPVETQPADSDAGPARERPKRSRKKPKYSREVQNYVAHLERRAQQDERKPSRGRVPVDLILGILLVAAGVLIFVFTINIQPAPEDGKVLPPEGLVQEANRMTRTIVISGICFTLVGLGAMCLWKGGGGGNKNVESD